MDWKDSDQKTFVRQKSALTRAQNRKDHKAVIAACDAFDSYWEARGHFPDDWSRWARARDDAKLAIQMERW